MCDCPCSSHAIYSSTSGDKDFDVLLSCMMSPRSGWTSLENQENPAACWDSLTPLVARLPRVMEEQWGFRLCLLERDLLPGGGQSNTAVFAQSPEKKKEKKNCHLTVISSFQRTRVTSSSPYRGVRCLSACCQLTTSPTAMPCSCWNQEFRYLRTERRDSSSCRSCFELFRGHSI